MSTKEPLPRVIPGWGLCFFLLLLTLPVWSQTSPTWQTALSVNPAGLGGSVEGTALGHDLAGNLYVTGSCRGIVRLGTITLRNPSSKEAAFVGKVTPAGRWLWAQVVELTPGARCRGESLAVSTDGLYLTGTYSGSIRFGQQALSIMPQDKNPRHFIARLDTAGRWQWVQPMRADTLAISQVVTDAAGSAYVNGGPAGSPAPALAGKLSRQGHWLWSSPAPMGPRSLVTALAVTPAGKLFLAGNRLADPPKENVQRSRGAASSPPAWFVASLSLTGQPQWTTTPPAAEYEFKTVKALRVGPHEELFLAGEAATPRRTRTGGFIGISSQPRVNFLIVARLSPTGRWEWTSTVSSPQRNTLFGALHGGDLTLDSAGNLCLTGYQGGSLTFATRPAATTLQSEGPFIAWLSPAGQWLSAASPTAGQNREEGRGAPVLSGGEPRRPDVMYLLTSERSAFDSPFQTLRVSRVSRKEPSRWQVLTQAEAGGSSWVQALAPVGNGDLAVAGKFTATLSGAGKSFFTPAEDLLVGVIKDNGQWRWQLAGGFPDEMELKSLAADSSGNLYVLGICRLEGRFRLDSSRMETELINEAPDASTMVWKETWFIAQAGPEGRWRWARHLGNTVSMADEGVSMAVDPAGNVWVAQLKEAGSAGGGSSPAVLAEDWGQPQAYTQLPLSLAHYNIRGELLSSHPVAFRGSRPRQLVYSPAGALYLGGSLADSATFTSSQGLQRLLVRRPGTPETFVARLSLAGTVEWVRPTGPGWDVTALAPGPRGSVWVGGALGRDTTRLTLVKGTGMLIAPDSGTAGAVGLLEADGSWRWAQPVGSSRYSRVTALASDDSGRLHVAGEFTDSISFNTRPPETRLRTRENPGRFITQVSAGGEWLSQASLEQNITGGPVALAALPDGRVMVGGAFLEAEAHFGKYRVPGYPAFDSVRTSEIYGPSPGYPTGFLARISPWGDSPKPPQAITLRPRRGQPGTRLTLTGSGLAGVASVKVGGVAAAVEIESAEKLTFTVPEGVAAGLVPVEVRTAGGQAQATQLLRVKKKRP